VSVLFWAVFDEEQKKLTEDMLIEFEKEARDELGMTSIMTKVADSLFPGSSVTHTRLRYLFFVGKILYTHLKKEKKLDSLENKIRDALKKNYENDIARKGIFGVSFDGEMTVKQPSYKAYFSLLKKWSIIDENVQISSLNIDCFDKDFRQIIEKNDYSENLGFELEDNEKEYIKDKLEIQYRDSLFYRFFIDEKIVLSGDFIDLQISIYSDEQQELIKNAQNFSILMWGSALYYNHFLGIDVEDKFKEWLALQPRLVGWNLKYMNEKFLGDDTNSKDFIERWYEITQNYSLDITNEKQTSNLKIKELIEEREKSLRHKKARLSNDKRDNKPHGIHMMNYRWNHIQTFINDFRSVK